MWVQTLFSGSFSVGVALSAFVFGAVIERFGYRAMFVAAAACIVFGLVLLWASPRAAAHAEVVELPGEERGVGTLTSH